MAIADNYGLWIENAGAVNNAIDYRRLLSRMLMGWDVRTPGALATEGTANGGVCRSGDLLVSQRGAGANMSVDVARGGCIVGGTQNADQGEYFVYSDAVVNVALAAADPTNARKDLIGVRIRDEAYSGSDNDAYLVAVTGTPAGSPAEPTAPENFVTLALVDVPATDTQITDDQITDRRRRVSALGGVTVCTSATRPTVSLWEGKVIYETDTNAVQVYTGAAWAQIGPITGAWTTYTPTLTQSGAVAKTTNYASYMKVGRSVIGNVHLTCSGAGTGNNKILIGLPTAASASVTSGTPVGAFTCLDSGTASYVGTVCIDGASTVHGIVNGLTDVFGTTNGGGPVTLANNDEVKVCFHYEAAA